MFRHLSRLFLCLRPSRSRSHSIPRSFLVGSLSALVEGLDDALLLCPECALCLFSLRQSCLSLPFALSPLSRRVLVDVIRPLSVVAHAAGASPHVLGSVGAHGVRGGSTYIALRRPWSIYTVLKYAPWGTGRCLMLFPARLFASINGDCFSLPDLYVSQLKKSRGVVLLGHVP